MRYLATVDTEVITADSEQEAEERFREMLRLGAVVVNVGEIEGEQE